jgi:hypothetical protein
MFNEILVKEKLYEMTNILKVVQEYVKEGRDRETRLIREIRELKDAIRRMEVKSKKDRKGKK